MALFDNLTGRLSRTVQNLRGRGRITEDNIGETLREVRMALLEADVALPVVKSFIEGVKAKALGAEVATSLTPGQVLIGILHNELAALMGAGCETTPPVVGGDGGMDIGGPTDGAMDGADDTAPSCGAAD